MYLRGLTILDILSAAAILSDLSSDQPVWLLSSYGPGKAEPALLAGLEESPEELRVKYVLAVKAGNMNDYVRGSGQVTALGVTYRS